MDICERYALHEKYKNTVKSMIVAFTSDLLVAIQMNIIEDDDTLYDLHNFIDDWVDDRIRPARFDE